MPFVKGQQRHPNAGRKKGSGEKRTTLTVRINEEVFDKFKKICLKEDISQSEAINEMIIKFIEPYAKVLEDDYEEVSESAEEVFEEPGKSF